MCRRSLPRTHFIIEPAGPFIVSWGMRNPEKSGIINRREFLGRAAAAGIAVSALPLSRDLLAAEAANPESILRFPAQWAFQRPKPALILVADQQLEDLQNPDKEVDISLTGTPQMTTLRKFCQGAQAQGARTVILAFDEFWSQYRKGQGGKPRALLPDTDDYIQRLATISKTLLEYGLALELSLLSPLEVGRGYRQHTGESGGWVQYREGYRDPKTGKFSVALWEQRSWTNNKGTIQLERVGLRVLAFQEQRVGATAFYAVDPGGIIELPTEPEVEVDDSAQGNTNARKMVIRGKGDTQVGNKDRVLVLVRYSTPEMDYFSPKALPFLRELVDRYHAAGVPLNGLYADEMHIQQNWGYFGHHDEGQFALRFLTRPMADKFAELYGPEFRDLEKFLVYFAYGQHGFLPGLEARLPAQHVFGHGPDDVARAALLRRRYYDLLEQTVVDLFTNAKHHAQTRYGHELEARAHATWAQSPTIDLWRTGEQPLQQRQYDYTSDFIWSNTVQQASAACSDYFAWNRFLTGGGNDHAEGGWLDRNYYGIALACSTGSLNETPYAYAVAWGMPGKIQERHQAVCNAFGASATPWFQAVQDCQHRAVEVLFVYPHSLVAAEERFGSWMAQYGYANYVSPRVLVERGRISADGRIELAGRHYNTVAILFEPLPPAGMLELLGQFAEAGGKVVWSGPPPRVDLAGAATLEKWQRMFGVASLQFGVEGRPCPGRIVKFEGTLREVPPQMVLTDFLVDMLYPIAPASGVEVVAQYAGGALGTHRPTNKGGSLTFLGLRPRDDQSASLGDEARTWFEILKAIGAYPGTGNGRRDNPSVLSRQNPWVACSFPNGTTAFAPHFHSIAESWPGGFHRDQKQDDEIVSRTKMPSPVLHLDNIRVNGRAVSYQGKLGMAFRTDKEGRLIAFAGEDCASIGLDGQEHVFASARMPLISWAPVLEDRKVPGGAVMELWVQGEAEVAIPLPHGAKASKLCMQGAQMDRAGAPVPCRVEDGKLTFKAERGWGRKRLYLLQT